MSPQNPGKLSEWTWHRCMLHYIGAIAGLNLVWEFAQMPFYTIWQNGSLKDLVYSPIHCTVGDIFIASLALLASILILGNSQWPHQRYVSVAAGAVVIGLIYTCYSEWQNVYVRKSWAYSDLMPVLPGTGIGLLPILQWLIIPCAVLATLRSD